eukprot:scaffold7335_cov417-Prasinococcus_capsulatus_cf.AAC.4
MTGCSGRSFWCYEATAPIDAFHVHLCVAPNKTWGRRKVCTAGDIAVIRADGTLVQLDACTQQRRVMEHEHVGCSQRRGTAGCKPAAQRSLAMRSAMSVPTSNATSRHWHRFTKKLVQGTASSCALPGELATNRNAGQVKRLQEVAQEGPLDRMRVAR